MATAFAPPEGYDFEYDFRNFDPEAYDKANNEYIERLRKFCKDHTDSNSNLVGETVKTGSGDGYAVYMVFRTKPLQIIHVPIGDAWHADECWIRGLRVKDVKQMVESDKKLKGIFGRQ